MKTKVLFVCVGNTCRSPMAEYIARAKFGDVFESTSAGLRPQTNEDARSSIETLWDVFKIDAASHQPQDVRSLAIEHLDLVVAMDTSVADGLTTLGAPYPGISSGISMIPSVAISRCTTGVPGQFIGK